MKKNSKSNRKSSRKSSSVSTQKLFRSGSHGFEALESRQMLDAALTNALLDSPIPYTTDADGESTTFLTVTPTSDTAPDGTSIYAGIRIYGMDSTGVRTTTEGFTISSIDKVDADGNKTPIPLLEKGKGIQDSYSFACAEMLLGQEYSITVSWTGDGEAPNFGAVAYLLGDTDSFDPTTGLPAVDPATGDYAANHQADVSDNEAKLVEALIYLDDPQTNWQHNYGSNLLKESGYTEEYAGLFSLDTDGLWDTEDLDRVEENSAAGTVNFNITFDQEAPALTVDVTNADGEFAGTGTVTEGEKTGKVQDFTVDVKTSADSPILNLTFADAKSAIKSIKYSTDGTTYTEIPVGGDSKTEDVTIDVADVLGAALTEGTPAEITFEVADVIGNTGKYAFTINYDAEADFNVGDDAEATLAGDGTSEGDVLFTNDADGSTEVVVDPDFALNEGDSTSQRVGIEYNGETYWSDYQTFDEENPTGTLDLTQFDGLLDAMGAQDGVIPDGSYDLTVFVQDDYGHDPQQVGDPQTLVIDTTAPVIETVSVDGDTSGEVSLEDLDTVDVIVTLASADATNVTIELNGKTETIPAGNVESDPIAIFKTTDYVYGKNELTVTATDKAGNSTSETFVVWYNTTPEATAFEAAGSEWGPGNVGHTTEEYVALDFSTAADDNDETPVENLVITVPADALANGALYEKSGDEYTLLEPEDGVITFKATDSIFYLPNKYWSGTETLPFTVTDDANTPATSDSKNVLITIDSVQTQAEVEWTSPAAVDENSLAEAQIIGTFTYPANEARDWTAVWMPGDIDAHILNSATDAEDALFDTVPTFTVVEGDTVDGVTTYNIKMDGWTLAEYVWGTEDFTVTVSGVLSGDDADVVTNDSDDLTFTVSPVNQNPTAGTAKQYNVSLSTLSKQDVALTLDDTMFSDIDDAYDDLTIASVTLTSGENSITLGQDESASLEVNGVDTIFTLSGKTITIASNDAAALDKGVVDIEFTVVDNYGGSEDVAGSTIKFSAYTSDDEVETVQDVSSFSFNVLGNDYANSEGWDGKTFAISGFTAIDPAIGTLELTDANSVDGDNFTFTPAEGYRGTFTFNYTIANQDDESETADATVTVVVAALNTAPIANDIASSGTEWGAQDEQATPQYIAVDFSLAISDNAEETAQEDLTIAFTSEGYADNGTWYQSADGETFTEITDFSAIQLADGGVYFLPNEYWNGTVNVSYQVTDTVENWVNSSLKIADGATPLTASNTVVITVTSEATTPIISDLADLTVDETVTPEAQTVNVAKASLPDGAVNEALLDELEVVAGVPEAHKLNDGSDSLDALLDGAPVFDIDADGQITCEYTPLANVYGAQTFTITVKTDDGGSATFDWTITVDPVNDAPVITVNEDVFEAGEGDQEGIYLLKRDLTEEAEPTVNNTINLGTVSDIDNVLATANITYYTVSGTGGHVWTSNADDAQALFSSADFAVNGDNELIFTYTLAPHVHGYADIVINLNDLESTVDPTNLDSNQVTYRINVASVNDAPVADDVNWSVSISSLSGTPSFDFNDVVSDIDNDAWTITALTLGETAIDLEGTATAVTVGDINLWATYDPEAKTLTLDAPDGVDLTVLDKQSLALAYTVNDNSPLGELTADGTGTVSFTMYAQDDEATYDEQAQDTVRTIDVLANDRPIWEQEGKTFTLSEVSALSDESAGAVAIVDGKVEYTQAQDYRGTVTFTYTIVNDDDPTETATATVTVLVRAINAAPTADTVNAQTDESQSGDDMVQLNFADAVADRETADENLIINVDETAVENGTLVGADGNALPAFNGVIAFYATDAVYFKPNQYYNGETTIPYTVTDRLDDLAGYTLVDGETAKTAASNVIVIVTPVGTTPTVELEDASADEIASGAESTTIQIGTASMPAGAEGLNTVSAVSKNIDAHITASDTQDSLITDYSFDLDTETGAVSFTYTPIEHVWGTQTFNVTVTSVEYGTKTVEWTLTINPVNDSPEVQVDAIGSGAKESEIQVSFDVVDIETPTADLTYTLTTAPTYGTLYKDGEALAVGDTFTTGNAITYRVYDGAPEDITGDSFVYAVTDRGADAGLTDADSITVENLTGTIEFNQAPVINNYVGTKTVDTTAGAQSGKWLLFNLSDVVDPEGEPITKDNITLSGDAYWDGDAAYIDYDIAQGKFGSKEALVTIEDPVDNSITSEYEFKLAAVASVGLHLSETRAATDSNPLYVDFANNTVSSTDSPLDVATILGEGPYTVTPNFSAGDDAQETGTHSRPVYWQVPDGATASDFWTTEPNEYPVYVNGVKQSGQYWKADTPSAEIPEDSTGFDTTYPKMVAAEASDANNPVIATVTEDGKLTMQIAPYTPAIDLDGSVTISNGENSVTIPVSILNAYESPTTVDIQYFVTDQAGSATLDDEGSPASIGRDEWFSDDVSAMSDHLTTNVDTQLTDSANVPLYWDLDYCEEEYWTKTPNDYPVYNNGNPEKDVDNDGLQWFWDLDKVSLDGMTTNVKPSRPRDRYEVMQRSVGTIAKSTTDLEYNAAHNLYLYASDSWNQEGLNNPMYMLLFEIDFGAPVAALANVSTSLGSVLEMGEWNEDHSAIPLGILNIATSDGNIYENAYSYLASLTYKYTSAFTTAPTVTIKFSSVMRDMGEAGRTVLNTEQYLTGWAENCNPNPALYGTQGANQTVVEGAGVYMVVSTADEASSAAALPESESWINEWQSHYVDLYLNTQDADVDVAGNVSFTLNYGDLFTATDFIAMENVFDGGFQIDVENNAVQISGRLKDTVTVEDGFVLLGRVKFESVGDDGLAADTVGTVDLGLSLDKIQLYNSAEEQIAVNTNVSVGTRAAAVVYDANDDGVIDVSDFISFATYYGTDTLASNDALAWALDFNKSGSIDASDFVEFATNYGASRANGKAVNFSEGFLKQYIGATIQGEGDADLAKLLDQAVGEWEAKLGIDLDVNIQIKVKNYEDTQLGESYIVSLADDGRPLTGVIVLDTDAAGLYWSINTDEVLEGKYDLYTVILHEVGHVLGFTDQYSAFTKVAKGAAFDGSHASDASDLMYETINPGERKEVSDFDASVVNGAYQYAQTNNVYLTFAGSAAMTGTQSAETFQPEIASGIVEQAEWTKTLETKVYEELDRIVAANRDSVFAATEDDAPILDDFSAGEFVFNLATKQETKDSLFDDLSWIDGDDAETDQELDVELKPEF